MSYTLAYRKAAIAHLNRREDWRGAFRNGKIPRELLVPGKNSHSFGAQLGHYNVQPSSSYETSLMGSAGLQYLSDPNICFPYTRRFVIVGNGGIENYFNASWVRELHRKQLWMATQAPHLHLLYNFFNLFFQKSGCKSSVENTPSMIRTIVQLNAYTEEERRLPTGCYLPPLGRTRILEDNLKERGRQRPPISVTVVEEKYKGDIDCIKRVVRIQRGGEQKYIRHLQYLGWPDGYIPTDEKKFIKFVKYVDDTNQALPHGVSDKERANFHPHPPALVHCLAGAGRTGAFICASSIILNKNHPLSEAGKQRRLVSIQKQHQGSIGPLGPPIEINDSVAYEIDFLREQRPRLAYSEAQLYFLYDLVRGWIARRPQEQSGTRSSSVQGGQPKSDLGTPSLTRKMNYTLQIIPRAPGADSRQTRPASVLSTGSPPVRSKSELSEIRKKKVD